MSTRESLGFGPYFSSQLDLLERPELVPARIAAQGQSGYLLVGCRAAFGELSGRLRHRLTGCARPAVGDWVAVTEDGELAIIHHLLDRRTEMLRRAAASEGTAQVVAANVDVVLIVTSANSDLNPRRLERYLATAWDSGARPVIVLNKIDLVSDPEPLVERIDQVALGVPILTTSALTDRGLDELRAVVCAGVTAALVGSSGVGKSSLINRLLGTEAQAVADLRRDQRGRHTTTGRLLLQLPGGGMLIDTPGMRELGLVDDSGGLAHSFSDVEVLADDCHFRDCQHQGEPGCAVEAAIERGELSGERLASFHKLTRELESAERRRDPALAGRAKRRWKSISLAVRAHARIDPKRGK